MKLTAFVSTAIAATFAFVICGSAPAAAKGGGPKPKVGTPKTHGKPAGSVAPKGGTPKGGAPKGSAPKGGAVKGGAPKGSAPKGTAPKGSAPKGGAAKGSLGNTSTKPSKGAASSPKKDGNATFGNPGTPPPGGQLSHAQQLLLKNTELRAKIESRLGSDAVVAAAGFRNLGQFQAAVNASFNQGYNFADLKALMTGPEALSLGQAKKRLRAGGTVPPPPGNPTGPGTGGAPPGGFGNPPPAAAPQPGGFGNPPAAAPQPGGFGNPPAAAPQPGGFGNPPPDTSQPGGFGNPAPAPSGATGTTSKTTKTGKSGKKS